MLSCPPFSLHRYFLPYVVQFNVMPETKSRGKKKRDRKVVMNKCYFTLGKQLDMDEDENGPEDNRVKGKICVVW